MEKYISPQVIPKKTCSTARLNYPVEGPFTLSFFPTLEISTGLVHYPYSKQTESSTLLCITSFSLSS